MLKESLKKSKAKKFRRSSVIVDNIDNYINKLEQIILTNRKENVKELSAISLMLLLTGARVGNDKSLNQICNLKYNESFGKSVNAHGISTLFNKHIDLGSANIIKLNYIGKKQVQQSYVFTNKVLHYYLKEKVDINNPDGKVFSATNNEIRKFINKNLSKKVLIKDTRTAIANYIFSKECDKFNDKEKPKTKKEFDAELKDILKVVSEQLGNTPAVCKSKYCSYTVMNEFFESRSEKLAEKAVLSIEKQFKKLKKDQLKTLVKKKEE